jgi:hypothetical protein
MDQQPLTQVRSDSSCVADIYQAFRSEGIAVVILQIHYPSFLA